MTGQSRLLLEDCDVDLRKTNSELVGRGQTHNAAAYDDYVKVNLGAHIVRCPWS